MLGCVGFGWASFSIWLFYLWQFLFVLQRKTPLLLSAEFSPPAISDFCAAIMRGLLLHKLGPGVILLMAMVAFCVHNVILATMPVDQTYWAQTFISLVMMPWGMDMLFSSSTIILSNSMPREHQGLAASLFTTVINYSISLGLGFAGTIESRVWPMVGRRCRGTGVRGMWGLGLRDLGLRLR